MCDVMQLDVISRYRATVEIGPKEQFQDVIWFLGETWQG